MTSPNVSVSIPGIGGASDNPAANPLAATSAGGESMEGVEGSTLAGTAGQGNGQEPENGAENGSGDAQPPPEGEYEAEGDGDRMEVEQRLSYIEYVPMYLGYLSYRYLSAQKSPLLFDCYWLLVNKLSSLFM